MTTDSGTPARRAFVTKARVERHQKDALQRERRDGVERDEDFLVTTVARVLATRSSFEPATLFASRPWQRTA